MSNSGAALLLPFFLLPRTQAQSCPSLSNRSNNLEVWSGAGSLMRGPELDLPPFPPTAPSPQHGAAEPGNCSVLGVPVADYAMVLVVRKPAVPAVPAPRQEPPKPLEACCSCHRGIHGCMSMMSSKLPQKPHELLWWAGGRFTQPFYPHQSAGERKPLGSAQWLL